MKIKKEGQIIELDPKKQYIMIVNEERRINFSSRLGHTEMANGRIFFVGSMAEFKFIENSNRVVDIREEITNG